MHYQVPQETNDIFTIKQKIANLQEMNERDSRSQINDKQNVKKKNINRINSTKNQKKKN